MSQRFLSVIVLTTSMLFMAALCQADTAADLHPLRWYVHVDMIDVPGGRDLAFYQDLITEKTAEANDLIQGKHGPSDTPCCQELQTISVSLFGSPADGLDMIDTESEWNTLKTIGGSGSRAFLFEALNWCGSSQLVLGCADLGICNLVPDNDPDLLLAISMAAHDVYDRLPATLAHERGHNTCLTHILTPDCAIMLPAVTGGGCLSANECSNYESGRLSTGGSCDCHMDDFGTLESDGTTCVVNAGDGFCSGGLCGEPGSDASVRLLSSGGPGASQGLASRDSLLASGLTGGWSDQGAFSGILEVSGLAHAPRRGVTYGVLSEAGDDTLITIDPATGLMTGTVGTLNGIANLLSLAFDPGNSINPADDRLLAIHTTTSPCTVDDSCNGFLVEIDPDTAVLSLVGQLQSIFSGGVTGLAYDNVNSVLYGSAWVTNGLFEIDTTCFPTLCGISFLTSLDVGRQTSSLTYSDATQRLYLIGALGDSTLYDSIDPTTEQKFATLALESYSDGGVAAIPIPEPEPERAVLWLVAIGTVAAVRVSRSNI